MRAPFHRLFAAALAVCVAAAAPGADAQTMERRPDRTDPDRAKPPAAVPKRPAPEKRTPALFNADEVTYDRAADVVTATGRVEVSQNDRILQADRLVYDRRRDVMTATGNVRIVEPTGEVIFADTASVTGDLKEGAARDIRLRMSNDARVAANGGTFSEGNRTELVKAVYTPCESCPERPERAPLWQVKARKIVHDKTKQDIYFYDATLEFFGIPVAYTPYMAHADPTVDRRSGFLAPVFEQSRQLGFGVTVPYFWAIDPSSDLTLYPRVMSERGLLLGIETRKRFDNGSLRFTGTATRDTFHERPGAETRGHFMSEGRFDIDEHWRAGFQGQRATDKTYMRFYDIGSYDFLTSKAYAERFDRRSYGSVFAYAFQELRSGYSSRQTPYVVPVAAYNYVGEQMRFGGHFIADASVRHLFREEGTDSTRVMARVGYDFTHITRDGHVFNVLATVRGDIYDIKNAVDPDDPAGQFTGTKARAFPQISADWRYPMIRRIGESSYATVEPIVGFVAAPNVGRQWRYANEDAIDQVYDETNLFSPNRSTGDDRLEGGQRLNYGMKLGLNAGQGGSSWFFVGQSFRLQRDTSYPAATGLRSKISDPVTALSINPGRYWDIFARARFDKEHLSRVRQADAYIAAGPREFRVIGSYALIDEAQSTLNAFGDRQEGRLGFIARPHENWKFGASIARDLERGATRQMQGLLEYEDECFLFGIRLSRRYYTDRDVKPDNRVAFRFVLKQTTDTNY
ncbi:MAG: LPS-assembly protein LptD [Rhodospirillales bacterium]|nr:MAG: LPS-assembly protein LptD [Rhodospirillales bacterium]